MLTCIILCVFVFRQHLVLIAHGHPHCICWQRCKFKLSPKFVSVHIKRKSSWKVIQSTSKVCTLGWFGCCLSWFKSMIVCPTLNAISDTHRTTWFLACDNTQAVANILGYIVFLVLPPSCIFFNTKVKIIYWHSENNWYISRRTWNNKVCRWWKRSLRQGLGFDDVNLRT